MYIYIDKCKKLRAGRGAVGKAALLVGIRDRETNRIAVKTVDNTDRIHPCIVHVSSFQQQARRCPNDS